MLALPALACFPQLPGGGTLPPRQPEQDSDADADGDGDADADGDGDADADADWTQVSGVQAMAVAAYFDEADWIGEDYAYASLRVFSDVTGHEAWEVYGTELDGCEEASRATEKWASTAVASAGSGTWTLTWDADLDRYTADVPVADWQSGGWGIAMEESQDNPAFSTDSFYDVPGAPTVSTLNGHDRDVVYLDVSDGLALAWDGDAEAFVSVTIIGLDSGEALNCLARDDGSFTIPSSKLGPFDIANISGVSEYLFVAFARFRVAETTLDWNGGSVLGAGVYQLGAYVYPYVL
jgi:hypothetical protein